jgi:hypothetical protein
LRRGQQKADNVMSLNTIEKRAIPRQRVLKTAIVAFAGRGIPCTVRNLSSNGAALDVPTTISLPSSFTLMIGTSQLIRRCRSIWRNDTRVGVVFD